MANNEDVARLRQGVAVWNAWRAQNRDLTAIPPPADLSEADLRWAVLRRAYLIEANLHTADLWDADLSGADLSAADLSAANLSAANLSAANLERASLINASLVGTDLTNANLTGCRVYGISAWDLKLEGAKQRDLVITNPGQPEITVDNIEVGQFIYLLLHNEKIRSVIDTITSKVVLILGRFTPERKAVLDALREDLRKRDYLPVLFDFDKPASRDITETVSLLARHGSVRRRGHHRRAEHPARTHGHRAGSPVSPDPAVAAGRGRGIRHVRALPALPLGAQRACLRVPPATDR